MDISNWIAIGELVIAIVGIIVGCIGAKELKEANELKIQVGKLRAEIQKIEVNNSQVATTINNNGIGVQDTELIAKRIVEERVEELPKIHYGIEEPDDTLGKNGDLYFKIID